MKTTAPVQATIATLQAAIKFAGSPQLFLSIYLPTNTAEITTEGIRLKLTAMLNELSRKLLGTPWEESFGEERKVVEGYLRSLRPGGRGLVILSSLEAKKWETLWLPFPVEEHVRFGPGAYVLPLLDIMGEWEPTGLAMVAQDSARLLILGAGQIEEVLHLKAEATARDATAGRVSPRLQRSGLTREAGGGGAARFQRHLQVHVDNHLKRVVRELDSLHRRHAFRRLFLAGPAETLALFKSHLTNELKSRLVGELSIGAHASDEDIRRQVLHRIQGTEPKGQKELVEEVITRAEKEAGAVVGLAPTLWALNRGQLRLLVLAGETSETGRCCMTCELLFPPEDIVCPRCEQKTLTVDLWEELPGLALRRNVPLEVVHGEAASLLWHYDSIGGLLEPTRR